MTDLTSGAWRAAGLLVLAACGGGGGSIQPPEARMATAMTDTGAAMASAEDGAAEDHPGTTTSALVKAAPERVATDWLAAGDWEAYSLDRLPGVTARWSHGAARWSVDHGDWERTAMEAIPGTARYSGIVVAKHGNDSADGGLSALLDDGRIAFDLDFDRDDARFAPQGSIDFAVVDFTGLVGPTGEGIAHAFDYHTTGGFVAKAMGLAAQVGR